MHTSNSFRGVNDLVEYNMNYSLETLEPLIEEAERNLKRLEEAIIDEPETNYELDYKSLASWLDQAYDKRNELEREEQETRTLDDYMVKEWKITIRGIVRTVFRDALGRFARILR